MQPDADQPTTQKHPVLTLDALQAVIVTAEDLSFTRAAQRLFMSTSGLSRRVRVVEHALQLEVFERTTRAVRLTPAGQALLPHIAKALAAIDDGVAAAQAAIRGD